MWTYRGTEGGEPLFYVARFEADLPAGRKEVLPYSPGPDGWRWRAPPPPRPLYGLDRLAARPDAPVLVVEGEKCADAAGALFPDYAATTWPGGAQAAAKADWTPLRGRHVTCWPDNDVPGRAAAAEAAKLALTAGAARVAVVNVPAHWPPAWDLAEALPEGVTLDTLRALLETAEPVGAVRAARDPLDCRPIAEGVGALALDTPYFVKGLLHPGDLALLVGPPGCGKTTVAPDLAWHVAAGLPFLGRRARPAPVLYVPLEGRNGLMRRFAALARERGAPPPVFVATRPINLLADGAEAVSRAAEACG
ncbi:MAG: AAA family ATPase, partial [Roseococcus sp.]|nr:AAA family ATPase [Roseococcus sp.]